MSSLISQEVMLILNCVLLGACFLVLLYGVYRIFKVKGKNRRFLLKFFGLATVISAIQLGLQVYQVVDAQTFSTPILIVINIYAMAFETAAMFILSDYWGQTTQILKKQSTEEQLQAQTHWIRLSVLVAWLICFSVYAGYVFGAHQVKKGDLSFEILVLGCQGLAVALSLWANVLQIIKGYQMSSTLKRYEQWVNDLSIHKRKFCFLYWIGSLMNLLRSLFLIAGTLVVQFTYNDYTAYTWIFIYGYSFSNIPILIIYLTGFSTQSGEIHIETVLLQARSSTSSRRQTELSPSRSSSKSIQQA